MAKSGRATQGKRVREMQKKDKRQEKAAKRTIRKDQKAANDALPGAPGEDPDLAGIVPGPQKPQE